MKAHSIAIAVAAALLLCAEGAAAQSGPRGAPGKPAAAEQAPAAGHLNAFACEALERPLRVDVELLDNTDANMRLRDVFVETLKKMGAEITPRATSVLSLDIETIREAEQRKPGDMVDLRLGSENPDARIDSPIDNKDDFAEAHVNIWSNQRDSVIGGRRNTVERQAINQLRVTINIYSRQDGRCLWRGEALHQLDSGDERIVAEHVMRVLADAVGKPASHKPIRPD